MTRSFLILAIALLSGGFTGKPYEEPSSTFEEWVQQQKVKIHTRILARKELERRMRLNPSIDPRSDYWDMPKTPTTEIPPKPVDDPYDKEPVDEESYYFSPLAVALGAADLDWELATRFKVKLPRKRTVGTTEPTGTLKKWRDAVKARL